MDLRTCRLSGCFERVRTFRERPKLPPVLILAVFTGLLPASAFAASDNYACNFTRECLGQKPCSDEIIFPVTLERHDDGWKFITMDDEIAMFQPLPGAPDDALVLISATFDPDGRAVSLMTVNPGGQTFLSTHGAFPEPAVVTHHGTCTPEVK